MIYSDSTLEVAKISRNQLNCTEFLLTVFRLINDKSGNTE